VKGLNDDVADGSPLFYVTTSVAITMDPATRSIRRTCVSATRTTTAAGVNVVLVKGIDGNAPNKLVTDENGATATFTVALTSQPRDDVTITLSSSDTTEGTLWTSSLTFTSVNFAAPQTVTIAGVDDKTVDGNQPYTITVGPAKSKDLNFDGKFSSLVQVTNRDDDTAGVIVHSDHWAYHLRGWKHRLFLDPLAVPADRRCDDWRYEQQFGRG